MQYWAKFRYAHFLTNDIRFRPEIDNYTLSNKLDYIEKNGVDVDFKFDEMIQGPLMTLVKITTNMLCNILFHSRIHRNPTHQNKPWSNGPKIRNFL